MEKLILDCDTGQDDAVAIMMAAGSDKIKMEGIISVAGNEILENTLNNNLNLAEALRLDVPVFKGASGPLVRDRITAPHIHGRHGLDGPVFPDERKKQCTGDGIPFILDTIMHNPGEINLVCTGPLTDAALALRLNPDIAKNVKRIILMGGSMSDGNVTPSAEFNIYADPEAAAIVFSSGIEIYMMGLDVTLQVMLTPKILERYIGDQKRHPNRAREIFLQCMNFYTKSCLTAIHDYPAMHDPCCIAFLIDPSIFVFQQREIRVETKGEYTYGRTVPQWPDEKSRTHVGVKVDTDKFWNILAKSFDALTD